MRRLAHARAIAADALADVRTHTSRRFWILMAIAAVFWTAVLLNFYTLYILGWLL